MPLYVDKSVHIKILLKSKKSNTAVTPQQRNYFYKNCKVLRNPTVSKVATAALVEEWHHISSASVRHPHGYIGLDSMNKIFPCKDSSDQQTLLPFGTKTVPTC